MTRKSLLAAAAAVSLLALSSGAQACHGPIMGAARLAALATACSAGCSTSTRSGVATACAARHICGMPKI